MPPESVLKLSTRGCRPQLVQALEVVGVEGEKQHKIHKREYESARGKQGEDQDPDSIHQTELPRVARRVAQVPEARSNSNLKERKVEEGDGERHESRRERLLEDRGEQKPSLLWS